MTHPATRHWTTRRHLIVAAAVIVAAAWFAGQLSTALRSASPAGAARRTEALAPAGDIPGAVSLDTVAGAGDIELSEPASPDPTSPPPAPGTSAIAAPTTPAVPTSAPATSAPATSVTIEAVPVGTLDALAVLAGIPVELEHRDGYDRDLFAVWIDADRNGCDTRDEVLAAENLNPVGGECSATNGTWFSAYDNANSHDPSTLDVDHVVSLKETFDSGAWAWSADRRIAYGNDLTDGRTLVAVSTAANREKGDRDPSNWIPDAGLCDYLGDWIAIKARWGLSMDESEHGRLGNLVRRECAGLTIDTWPPAP